LARQRDFAKGASRSRVAFGGSVRLQSLPSRKKPLPRRSRFLAEARLNPRADANSLQISLPSVL
jgi:hypothetical protein